MLCYSNGTDNYYYYYYYCTYNYAYSTTTPYNKERGGRRKSPVYLALL